MRKVEIEVFEFDELNDEAKEKARGWFRKISDYPWTVENEKSLKAFCDLFGVSVPEYSYGIDCRDFIAAKSFFSEMDNEVLILKGVKAFSWIKENVLDKIQDKQNWLTGYCMDTQLIEPFEKYEKDSDKLLIEVFEEALNGWISACKADCEFCYSDENIDDSLILNEYEFTSDGEIFQG